MIELEAGDARVEVAVTDGGRLRQITVAGVGLLHDHPSGGPLTWGSYPMAPWAGRVRDGKFRFDHLEVQLPLNLPPHAIHGTTFSRPWTVVDAGRDYCELECELEWQFGGRAHQHLLLSEDALTCVLGVLATSSPMPAVIGWHPCFRTPEGAELEFGHMHARDAHHMATAELVAPKQRPWDDCFVQPLAPLRLHHPGLTVTVDSDCSHWVVYDEQAHLLCVEPQSGPPDAFNIGGAARLEPGELLQRTMTIGWRRHTD
jgi:aldose 1-epimerase